VRRFFIGLVAGVIVMTLLISHIFVGLAFITLVFALAFREILNMTRPEIPREIKRVLTVYATSAYIVFAGFLYSQSRLYLIIYEPERLVKAASSNPLIKHIEMTGLSEHALGTGLALLLFLWLSVFLIIAFRIIVDYPSGAFTKDAGQFVITLFSVLFIGLASFMIVYLSCPSNTWFIICLLAWGADAGAFFVGRTIGTRKLCPHVSPRKTVEGLIGALISGAIATPLYIYSIDRLEYGPGIKLTLPEILACAIVSMIIIGLAHLGDLFMSVVKRTHKMKESGTLLPEHGGVIDKLDSFLVVSIIVMFIVATIGQQF
jgi:phosphatidate cytidylyltransferase